MQEAFLGLFFLNWLSVDARGNLNTSFSFFFHLRTPVRLSYWRNWWICRKIWWSCCCLCWRVGLYSRLDLYYILKQEGLAGQADWMTETQGHSVCKAHIFFRKSKYSRIHSLKTFFGSLLLTHFVITFLFNVCYSYWDMNIKHIIFLNGRLWDCGYSSKSLILFSVNIFHSCHIFHPIFTKHGTSHI